MKPDDDETCLPSFQVTVETVAREFCRTEYDIDKLHRLTSVRFVYTDI